MVRVIAIISPIFHPRCVKVSVLVLIVIPILRVFRSTVLWDTFALFPETVHNTGMESINPCNIQVGVEMMNNRTM